MIYDAGGDKKKLKGIWDRYLSKNNDVMNGCVYEKKEYPNTKSHRHIFPPQMPKGLQLEYVSKSIL